MSEQKVDPKVIRTNDWKTLPDKLAPGPEISHMAEVKGVWSLRMYFIPPEI